MGNPIRILLFTALLVAASGAVSAAHAHSYWDAGASFRVGGFGFSFGFVKPYGGYHHHPGYYYRVEHRLDYPGYRCTDYCFRRDRAFYHYDSCPLVGAHFRHYRYVPRYGHWAPRYGDHSYGYGYGSGYGHRYDYRDRHYDYRKYKGRDYRGRDYRYRGRDHDYRGGGRDHRGRDRGYRGRAYDRDHDSDSDRRGDRRRRARPRPY